MRAATVSKRRRPTVPVTTINKPAPKRNGRAGDPVKARPGPDPPPSWGPEELPVTPGERSELAPDPPVIDPAPPEAEALTTANTVPPSWLSDGLDDEPKVVSAHPFDRVAAGDTGCHD